MINYCNLCREKLKNNPVEKLVQKIHELEKISQELEPSRSKRNEYIQKISDYANGFIHDLDISKAYSDKKVKQGVFTIDGRKKPISSLIKTYASQVAAKGIRAASGSHMGYIPGGGLYTSAVADFLADITNEYAGLYFASPGAVLIEHEILKWLKSVFGFPGTATGSLTSGGSMANMIAMTAARDHHKIKSGIISKSVIYLSPQTHHSIHKALKIIGLEDVVIRYTDLDEYSRIDVNQLKDQIHQDVRSGLNPFMIVATAGTTDTGAVDPLMNLGEIARENKLWYHIDAAYGGFFILTSGKKDLFRGIETADSLVIDPHKGLFLPSGTGAVLVKNKDALFHSHRYTANYMQDSTLSDAVYDPADVSPELTRHFRALRLWLPLQIHGIKPFIACLEEKLLLVSHFRKRIKETGFETGPEPDLSISYFWYPCKKTDENKYNRRLLELIHKDGRVFFSSTNINKKFVIRIAILSFRTKLKTIDKAIEVINAARSKLDKEL